MTSCPKCQAEQLDNAKFCSQCAAPLAASGQTVVKSKMPTWLAVVILLALAYIGVNVVYQNAAKWHNLTGNSSKTEGRVYSDYVVPLTNGAATVKAASYTWYKFDVPVHATNVVLGGHFTASGGTGNDIECYILNEDGFTNFKNGHAATAYYNSGKVTQAKIQARNLSPGTYYLMLDNRFSLLTPKAVQIQASLTYSRW